MKKNYLLLLLGILSLAFAVSCQKEELHDSQFESKVEVSAIFADANMTKTQHSSDYTKILWSKDDVLSVFSSAELCHDRYYLKDGDGTSNANFLWDKNYNGTISGGIDAGGSQEYFYVGVYPFMEETSVKYSNNSYIINTVLPTEQKYSENSFGEGALVMVGVDEINPKPDFAFKNTGTILIFPLNGDATIVSAALKSEKSKIAGKAVITVSAEDNFIPSTDVSNGESEIKLSCGEGIQLKGEEYTNFCFVLAPGIYDDLTVKFTDSYGNYFEQAIENPNNKEMKRSMSYNMPKMTFAAQGTEEIDLWVKAKAGAYMTATRIIPSVKDVDVEGWVKNLKDQANTKALIEEAITYISLKNYKAAYEVLGGIPGFVMDQKTFTANGSYIQKVDYTGAGYLVSMLEGIESINDIQSLLDYLNEFEKVYEASGLKNKLDDELGNIADNFDAFIDNFLEDYFKGDENVSDEEALAIYKAKIKEQLESSIDGCKALIAGINFFGRGEKYEKEIALMNAYIESAQDLYNNVDKLSKGDIENHIDFLSEHYTFTIKVPIIGNVKVDPSTFLTGAENAYKDKLGELIGENETLINASKAALRTAISEISSKSLVESLETAINEPESTTGLVLNYIFAQESFMASVKATLREIVAGIEEASKDNVDAGNVDKKQQAINTAIQNALINARVDAVGKIQDEFKAANEANLNDGPWGIFKKVLNWEPCVEVFTELKLLDVYNALVELTETVDQMITYDKGPILYDIENWEDYQENVDWWVLKFNEEL